MGSQALWHLSLVALLPALGTATVAISAWLIRHRRHTAAIRRRMAEFHGGRPELAAINGGEARQQGVWQWRKLEDVSGIQSHARVA